MLTQKNKLFIKYYISSLNATESAKKAGYSEKTAYSIGQRMLNHVEVKPLIDSGREELNRKYENTREDYIKKTYDLFEDTEIPAIKQRYWELVGKAGGHLKETGATIVQTRISIADIQAYEDYERKKHMSNRDK